MALKFERFTKTGGSFAPMVSVRRNGAFGLSQGALNRFGLLEGDWFVVLFYDRESNVIGIYPTKESTEEGAIKLIKRKSKGKGDKESISSSISAKAFFDFYDIPCSETRSFRAKWDETHKMILVHLNEEVKDAPKDEEPSDSESEDFTHNSGQAAVGNPDSQVKNL